MGLDTPIQPGYIGGVIPSFFMNNLVSQIDQTIRELGWDESADIVVEIGGTQVSGIDVGENYNKKWQSPKGTRKYNKDAFIIIKNLTTTPFESSKPNPDLIAHHDPNRTETNSETTTEQRDETP